MKKGFIVLLFLLIVIVAVFILFRPGVFSIQPIGALPEGSTFIYYGRNPQMSFFSSPDKLCLDIQGFVNLLCRGSALAAVPDLLDRVVIKLPYIHSAYLLSTGGSEFSQ